MISAELNKHLSTSFDIVIVLVGLVIAYAIWQFIRKNDNNKQNIIMASLSGVVLMYSVRIGTVIFGRMMAPPGMPNHPLWFEWRWLVITAAAIVALFFARRMFIAIDGQNRAQHIWLYAGILGLGLIGGFII